MRGDEQAASAEAVEVGAFATRLTSARFVGEVVVRVAPGQVSLTGWRVRQDLVIARAAGQWLLTFFAFAMLSAGNVEIALWSIVAAIAWAIGMYAVLGLTGTEETVRVLHSAIEGARFGWVWRPMDLLFFGSGLAMLSVASTGTKTVSFVAPLSTNTGPRVRYVLIADDQKTAMRLARELPLDD